MSKLNISHETNALLRKLNLEPPFVKEIRITPTTVTATVYKKNASGNKHLVETGEYLPGLGEEDVSGFSLAPATEEIQFEVRT